MEEQAKEIQVGQHVVFVDSKRGWHQALVTAVWGEPHLSSMSQAHGEQFTYPCINLVCVSGDPAKDDQYGRQIERETSIPYFRDSSAPGFCWLFPEDADEAKGQFERAEQGLKT